MSTLVTTWPRGGQRGVPRAAAHQHGFAAIRHRDRAVAHRPAEPQLGPHPPQRVVDRERAVGGGPAGVGLQEDQARVDRRGLGGVPAAQLLLREGADLVVGEGRRQRDQAATGRSTVHSHAVVGRAQRRGRGDLSAHRQPLGRGSGTAHHQPVGAAGHRTLPEPPRVVAQRQPGLEAGACHRGDPGDPPPLHQEVQGRLVRVRAVDVATDHEHLVVQLDRIGAPGARWRLDRRLDRRLEPATTGDAGHGQLGLERGGPGLEHDRVDLGRVVGVPVTCQQVRLRVAAAGHGQLGPGATWRNRPEPGLGVVRRRLDATHEREHGELQPAVVAMLARAHRQVERGVRLLECENLGRDHALGVREHGVRNPVTHLDRELSLGQPAVGGEVLEAGSLVGGGQPCHHPRLDVHHGEVGRRDVRQEVPCRRPQHLPVLVRGALDVLEVAAELHVEQPDQERGRRPTLLHAVQQVAHVLPPGARGRRQPWQCPEAFRP